MTKLKWGHEDVPKHYLTSISMRRNKDTRRNARPAHTEKRSWEDTGPGLHMQRKDHVRTHEEMPGLHTQRKDH